MRLILFAALAMLAACGADGPPLPPDAASQPSDGITITGEIAIGVSTRGN